MRSAWNPTSRSADAVAIRDDERAAGAHDAPGDARLALAQTTLGVLALAALIVSALWVLRPFVGPAIWAAMVVIATWPLMRRVQALAGGRRWLATTVMSLALLLLFVVPLVVAIVTIVGNVDRIVEWAKLAASFRMAEPPAWLATLPVVGPMLVDLWQSLVAAGVDGLLERLAPYAGNLTRWFVSEVGSLGYLIVQFLGTVAIAAVMYQGGEAWAATVLRIGERLGGSRGRHVVELAGDAVRGVALGVGVTALVQSLLGGLALKIAGVPLAGLLTAVMLMLCLAQVGPLPVLLAAVGWLFWQGDTPWAIALLVAAVVVGTIDNVIRPVLIRLGADLPMLLILAGVIGGLFAFGLVGIFVGPVVLAVAWTLLAAWIGDEDVLALDAVPQQLEPGEQHAELEQAVEQPRRNDAHDAHAEPDTQRGQGQQHG
ncbi:MAG: AI-2E family transporter YdiK [Burkholderiaceae bacterium]|nr:AI-2E family transporter YdiK [Burkholderiaceae bacterium]